MNKFQFRDLLRAAGEFTNAQVNGFYTRFCNEQITLEQILATAKPKDPVGVKGNYVDYRISTQKDEHVEQAEVSNTVISMPRKTDYEQYMPAIFKLCKERGYATHRSVSGALKIRMNDAKAMLIAMVEAGVMTSEYSNNAERYRKFKKAKQVVA